jgi:ubiquinone biosynthesis protein
MASLGNMFKLVRAGLTLMRYGVPIPPPGIEAPAAFNFLKMISAPFWWRPWTQHQGITPALTRLGPSYVKLGQFLATRDDLVGKEMALELTKLQDRLPPFPMQKAIAVIERELGASIDELFVEFGEPIAAASIAQVHKALVRDKDGERWVAVKVLRPGVEKRFKNDLKTFYEAAHLAERFDPAAKRLMPVAIVDTLANSVALEMDLRLEAAAISEMAENVAEDEGFRVPAIDWTRTSQKVLTTEWIDGIPLHDVKAVKAAGHDTKALGTHLIQSFLRHAMRDGFFHADMHQGNLFIDKKGDIVAIDFGIMGRLGRQEQAYLAEILNGFISRDYLRSAQMHIDAGYVPDHHSAASFAQALRAVGEPIQGRTADEISMGGLLGQLFHYTAVFDMKTRPELLMLQKTMVVVEGVARSLNPQLNMWTTAGPVVKEWMQDTLGIAGKLREFRDETGKLGQIATGMPDLLLQAGRTVEALGNATKNGVHLDDESIEKLTKAQYEFGRSGRFALWIGALSLLALAIALLSPLFSAIMAG